jgi:serine/threonine-protein kinase
MPVPSLLQRLKERKLVQWALAYLAGAWVLVEASNLAVERFHLPEVIGQAAFVIAFFGFLLTLVLAWYHGEKGRQRVSGSELLMVAGVLVVAGVALSNLGALRKTAPEPLASEDDDRPRVAVLPCENQSPDPSDGYLADALHIEIVQKLQGISSLRPVGRSSVTRFADPVPSADGISAELGIEYVGECSVQKSGDQIRLLINLLDGGTGGVIWGDDYSRDLTASSLFEIQSDIATEIARAIGAELSPEEQTRVGSELTGNLEALEYYYRGLEYLQSVSGSDLRAAEALFQRAADLDQAFAVAFARLSSVHSQLWFFSYDRSPERLEKAREAAVRALELNDGLGEAHQAMGELYYRANLDYERALEEFSIARGILPGSADLLHTTASTLRRSGKWEEAVALYQEAASLDPLRPRTFRARGETLALLRRYAEAEQELRRAQQLAPDQRQPYVSLSSLYARWEGSTEESRSVLNEAEAIGLTDIQLSWEWLYLEWLDGDHDAAFERLVTMDERFGVDSITGRRSLSYAEVHELRGDLKSAEAYYEAARIQLERIVQRNPEDQVAGCRLAVALAGLERRAEAIAAGERALALLPVERDALAGAQSLLCLAQVLAATGEADLAIEKVEELLSIPSRLTVPLLRLDPAWYPLRDHPRFQTLLETYASAVER